MKDRVAVDQANQLTGSLYLLQLENIHLRVFAPGRDFGRLKRCVRASFSRRGAHYCLWVTDPVVEDQYLARQDGDYPLGTCYATVSLGEPFEGYCYKLVAALITPDRAS